MDLVCLFSLFAALLVYTVNSQQDINCFTMETPSRFAPNDVRSFPHSLNCYEDSADNIRVEVTAQDGESYTDIMIQIHLNDEAIGTYRTQRSQTNSSPYAVGDDYQLICDRKAQVNTDSNPKTYTEARWYNLQRDDLDSAPLACKVTIADGADRRWVGVARPVRRLNGPPVPKPSAASPPHPSSPATKPPKLKNPEKERRKQEKAERKRAKEAKRQKREEKRIALEQTKKLNELMNRLPTTQPPPTTTTLKPWQPPPEPEYDLGSIVVQGETLPSHCKDDQDFWRVPLNNQGCKSYLIAERRGKNKIALAYKSCGKSGFSLLSSSSSAKGLCFDANVCACRLCGEVTCPIFRPSPSQTLQFDIFTLAGQQAGEIQWKYTRKPGLNAGHDENQSLSGLMDPNSLPESENWKPPTPPPGYYDITKPKTTSTSSRKRGRGQKREKQRGRNGRGGRGNIRKLSGSITF